MDRSDMIFKLLTSLNDKQDKQSEVLTRVEADLKYHIKRTDLLEETIKDNKYGLANKVSRPTLKQVSAVLGIITAIVGLAITIGF
jgi:hypothetical protein